MSKSKIEYVTDTWNPWIGCDPKSEGCRNCWAKREEDTRLRHLKRCGAPTADGRYFWGGPFYQGDGVLTQPLRWKKPRRVFVGSRTDLFHPGIIRSGRLTLAFQIMELAKTQTFLVLTKRAREMLAWFDGGSPSFQWPLPNVWLGVSVEDQTTANKRIPPLLEIPAAVRFVSAEPLLGAVDLAVPHGQGVGDLLIDGLDWLIVGGESGPGARPMHPDWARSIRERCRAAGVPFFFKQWGETDECGFRVGKKLAGRTLDGRTWEEMPVGAHETL